jgi:hypothetical protein
LGNTPGQLLKVEAIINDAAGPDIHKAGVIGYCQPEGRMVESVVPTDRRVRALPWEMNG